MGRKKKSDPISTDSPDTQVEPQPKWKKVTKLKFETPVDVPKKEIEVRSAELRDYMFCNYSYDHNLPGSITNSLTNKSGLPIHDDMKAVFKKLKVHLALICEEIKPEDVNDVDDIADYNDKIHKEGSLEHRVSFFSVHSWHLSGNYEKEGVILTGNKRLSDGDFVKLETPKRKWNSTYHFIEELRILIHDAIVEVEEYHKGKRAPEVQQELPFGGDNYSEEDL